MDFILYEINNWKDIFTTKKYAYSNSHFEALQCEPSPLFSIPTVIAAVETAAANTTRKSANTNGQLEAIGTEPPPLNC
jgi:hypothetical protein